ncbi:MAG: acetyl-CoA carboxylase carboxyl transferase subunit alpha [Deltaproteobacteria bacterium]|nr:acetyl-CoA carboxylase carboxyl transferase subunit alpha [Deltaproteobacteria bacterium]
MSKKDKFVDIDNALKDLQKSISKLKDVDAGELSDIVENFRQELYQGISRWSSVEIARHVSRPSSDEFIEAIFTDYLELHGDRSYEDDPAVTGGLAMLDEFPVVVIAHRKRSQNARDYTRHHFGMASPSGHYKAIRLMKLAEKFKRTVITFVDTPGAYPVPEAEFKGQSFSIAKCLETLAGLKTPVVACIIGEAGSGGALALGFGDRIIMLENAFYSSISPEGFSSIIYGDASRKELAADTLRGAGNDLLENGIIDYLIKEPVGGAHNEPAKVIEDTAKIIRDCVKELVGSDLHKVVELRARRIEGLIPSD